MVIDILVIVATTVIVASSISVVVSCSNQKQSSEVFYKKYVLENLLKLTPALESYF